MLPPPVRDSFALGLRLRLIGLDGQVIAPPFLRRQAVDRDASRVPIRVDGAVVGWRAVERNEIISDRLGKAFIDQQARSAWVILALALCVATLASWIMARQILQPLRRIAVGAKTLASGRYDVSLPVTGDELGELARDFNVLALALQRNERARRQWIADISHELRTPVSVLRAEIEALQDGVREPTLARIGSLHHEVVALSKLVRDLYDLALSDAGALTYYRESRELAELLNVIVDATRARLAQKSIALDLRIANRATVFADRQRLAQQFGNLLENVFRHTAPGGSCEIRLYVDDTKATVSFDDSEPGVPEPDLAHLFDRLFRVDDSMSRQYGGAGLGLAICKTIAESHQGNISARAPRLGGLWVQVTLPIRRSVSPEFSHG